MSTSRVRVWCMPWAASPVSPARWCSGLASASTEPTASRARLAGHSIPMAFLGTFILLVGWFGFNAGSTLAATDLRFTVVATNTAIAAAFGATIAMFYCMWRMGKPDPGMMANGMLAGLVAITAPCAFVQPWAAAVIGSIAAVIVVESVFFFERSRRRRPGRCHLGARHVRYLGRALYRDLRRRSLRQWLESHSHRRYQGSRCHRVPLRHQPRLQTARCPGHRVAGHHLRDGWHRASRSSSSRT